jgi:beta-galactosidase
MNPFPARLASLLFALAALFVLAHQAGADTSSPREMQLLNGADWQFVGAGAADSLPEVDSDGFKSAAWTPVSVPHNFQARMGGAYDTLTKGWYKRQVTVDPSAKGKELYLVFEGAASIADVYVNGQHLGQHRGAYTRFIFDATAALHPGDNELAVLVDDTPANTTDCLPWSITGLYKVWGGLYRNVWLVTTSQVHIDPTDFAAPGVYLTPKNVSADSADLDVRTLLRNTSAADVQAQVKARIVDPDGKEVTALTGTTPVPAHGTATSELSTTIKQPQLWGAHQGKLYHVETTILLNGKPVDELTQATGFRWLNWDWKGGNVTLNGKRIILYGADVHQETEEKGSAVSPEDLKANFDDMQYLGVNFMRFPHYPHAALEYELCDQDGILAWCEDGHSNSKDIVGPTAAQIVTEMVKQNYNHPSIVVWSMGNESNGQVADQCVPIAKALDPSRPVGVANQKSELADFHTAHCYYGWYHKDMEGYRPLGFISEIGAGGLVTTHCDYGNADWKVGKYEPEEYQQIVSENNFQKSFRGDDSHLGMFCVWCLRDFSDAKYKAPVGINSKGLETYAGDRKDVYYLYRTFLRPEAPTVWITSKRYFLRRGAVDNGIKVYSNAPKVTLTLNGKTVSTLDNGQYVIPNGPYLTQVDGKKAKKGEPPLPPPQPRPYVPEKIDNVFYWPVALNPGKNTVIATDDKGNSDSATIYYYGTPTAPAPADATLPIANLVSSNANNPAYFMDMPVQAQWPIYYDLNGTADNSWNTIPPEIEGASWIALLRVTKPDPIDTSKRAKPQAPEPDNSTNLSFTMTKPGKVYIMATKMEKPPSFAAGGGFTEVSGGNYVWRDNALILVPAQLYVHQAAAGEKISVSLGDREAVVLIKSGP